MPSNPGVISTDRRVFLTGAAAAAGGVIAASAAGLSTAGTAEAAVPVRRSAPGAVTVGPSDRRYADLRRGTNQRWVGSPERIHLATSTAEVVAAVQQAVDTGRRLAVRSGGHCYEDFTTHHDIDVVLDLSRMDDISYDARRKAFAVQPGAALGRVYDRLYKGWGVYLPAGNCPTVAAGGHIQGGGYGSMSRRDGLAVDHLYGIEIVVVQADGTARAITATREADDPHRDLWWAHTGGGGGNFGVVTRYWLRSPGAEGDDPADQLPTPPREVWLSEVAWPWQDLTQARFSRLMWNHGDWHARNSAPDSPYTALFSQLKPFHKSAGAVVLDSLVDAGAPGAERLLRNYIDAVGAGVGVEPEVRQYRRVPWLHATQWPGFTGPDPTVRFKGKSVYARRNYTDEQIAAAYRHLTRDDFRNPGALLMIASYGGAVNRVAPQDTAVPQRDSVLKYQVVSLWNDAADDEANIGWVRECYRDMFASTGGVPVPNETNDGCFVNYADTDLGDPQWNASGVPWHDLYYKDNYTRLQRVKAHWDPTGFFRHAQSVRPA
ncbi:FAD-binding oxidoreductase [Streptomyces minutiscleroticus]|uniref:FAD-linked oxidase n=1 Tax=Streptomyces minutiscleroticus TaxID=68238 RepID=A0A918P113_9ACTN|nr:FAD-binding protein [Streptomyces minutiscleroticus]GGY12526.1 FAD-linked oxidase [Streptomyces minutiscleroticus]